MVNTDMTQNTTEAPTEQPKEPAKPDDQIGIYIQGFLKITDPKTGSVHVEQKD